MAKLETFTKAVKYIFTKAEKELIADEQSRILTDIKEIKIEAKNVASQYANRVKTLEGELDQKTNKHICGYELRDKLCYLRKNYDSKQREYISVDGGLIVSIEPFYPSDYKKQYELKEEVLQAGLGKAKYLGMKFFYDKVFEIVNTEEYDGLSVKDVVNDKSHSIMSSCATYLINEKEVLSITDEVEFDSVFQTLQEWFDEFLNSGLTEPLMKDFPVYEEKDKTKKGKKSNDDLTPFE